MERKVIGYDKTIEYLIKGYKIVKQPMSDNRYIKVDNEYITVRSDAFFKLLTDNLLSIKTENWDRVYSLKGIEEEWEKDIKELKNMPDELLLATYNCYKTKKNSTNNYEQKYLLEIEKEKNKRNI